MKSLPQSSLNRYVLQRLMQRLSAREKGKFNASLYAGITVSNFLEKLEQDEEDTVVIKVNKEKYDPHIHDYKLVKSYKIKQEMVRKEFKEKIILHLSDINDFSKIGPETRDFKSTYGYVVKITITIKTEK